MPLLPHDPATGTAPDERADALTAAGAVAWSFRPAERRFRLLGGALLGYGLAGSEAPLPLRMLRDRVDAGDRERLWREARTVLEGVRPWLAVEFRARRPDGSLGWLRADGRRAGTGREARLHGLLMDVTTRREAAEAYRRAVQRAGAGIWQWDRQTDRFRGDRVTATLFGRSASDDPMDLGAFLELLTPDSRSHVRATLASVLDGRGTFDLEYAVRLPDGSARWLASRGSAVVDAEGHVTGLQGVTLDTTARHRAEDALRTAQKMDAVGRVAGGVAHEINNMMTVILGFAEVLQSRPEADEEYRQDLEEIRRAAERSAEISRQLLAFSRKALVQPTLVDPNLVLREMGNVLRRLLGDEARTALALAESLPPVRIDRGQLEQVCMNLALNARDAMPRGGTLTVRTREEALLAPRRGPQGHGEIRPGRYVVCAFEDTGVGMTPEVQARLFEPFFTTKPPGQGTGLGLATAYGIIKQAGGYIFVESAAGAGSTFTLYLPVARLAPGERVGDAPDHRHPRPRSSGTVLIVEDEPAVRHVTRRTLEADGFRVLEAGDGREALAVLESLPAPPDAIVCDIFMPEMGGHELARRLEVRWPRLPVLLISGYTEDERARRGAAPRGVEVLQKPFPPAALAERVRLMVAAARAG
ncbi:MAG: response regulator [Gemmatimonadales bacterium]|nr:response regulator [Gemmatimonadales bacterium]